MHPEIAADNLRERIALWSGLAPVPVVSSYWGMAVSRLLISGTRLGVFDALKNGEQGAEEIARRIGCDAAATNALLAGLNGFGYLKRRKGLYSLTRSSAKWLVRDSQSSMVEAMLFMADIWDALAGMETAVKSGRAPDFHELRKPPEFWSRYLRGLAIFAKFVADEITKKARLTSPPSRLLDVGGGHGVYSAAFCKKYPALKAEVLDLAPACDQGRKITAELGYSDRVSFREGDFKTADWGKGFQLVLLFNIIHTVPPDQAKKIIAKAFSALEPGGSVVILDSEHPGGENNLSATAGFNELFFFLINGTSVYPEDWIRDWVAAAGFKNWKRKRLLRMPMTLFASAKKP